MVRITACTLSQKSFSASASAFHLHSSRRRLFDHLSEAGDLYASKGHGESRSTESSVDASSASEIGFEHDDAAMLTEAHSPETR